MDEALEDAALAIQTGKQPVYYVTANVDFIAQAYGNESLKDILFHADRVVCDGMPLVWLSRYFKPCLPERIAGSDMVFRLFEQADQYGWKVYFLGSDDRTLAHTKSILAERYPRMKIVGTFSPPFGPVDSWPNDAIFNDIKSTAPDLLLVAVGCPKQEYWISQHYEQSGVPLSIGIGASLDFICGKQMRAPRWIQKVGMEWGWRMLSNPKRLIRRYAKDFYYLFVLSYRQWQITRRRRLDSEDSRVIAVSEEFVPVQKNECLWLEWHGNAENSSLDQLAYPDDFERPVFLDLSAVVFIDSSAIGLLARMARQARQAKVPFGLLRPSASVAAVVKAMRLEEQFPSYCDEIEAMSVVEPWQRASLGKAVFE
jgi:N-acetylglucosaminyldiphosphoundecaprenol N-acetyl-beta-D-mannosaminyltransferase